MFRNAEKLYTTFTDNMFFDTLISFSFYPASHSLAKSRAELEFLVRDMDADGSGEIDFDEFWVWYSDAGNGAARAGLRRHMAAFGSGSNMSSLQDARRRKKAAHNIALRRTRAAAREALVRECEREDTNQTSSNHC